MNVHTLLTIILVFFGIIFTATAFILTIILSRKSVKNNPKKATILIKNGAETIGYKGTFSGLCDKGYRYNYDKDKFVAVPIRYEPIFHRNRRLLFLNNINQVIVNPFGKDVELNPDEKSDLLYALVSGQIGAEAVKAIRGKTTVNIWVIAIIAFVIGAIAILGYNYMSKNVINQPGTTQTSNVTQKINTPPIGITTGE